MSWADLAAKYGYMANDPDAIDGIIDAVHDENMRGLINAFEAGMISGYEADDGARELGYDDYKDMVTEGPY